MLFIIEFEYEGAVLAPDETRAKGYYKRQLRQETPKYAEVTSEDIDLDKWSGYLPYRYGDLMRSTSSMTSL